MVDNDNGGRTIKSYTIPLLLVDPEERRAEGSLRARGSGDTRDLCPEDSLQFAREGVEGEESWGFYRNGHSDP